MSRLDPVFRGKMNAKRDVALDDKQAYYIWRCSFRENQEIELILRKRRKKRTKSQNSYLWGVVYPIIMGCSSDDPETEESLLQTSDDVHAAMMRSGYKSPDEVHEAMKWKFLRTMRGDDLPATVRSTSDLTTAEFSEYVDNIKRWASEFLGAYIPDAGDVCQ